MNKIKKTAALNVLRHDEGGRWEIGKLCSSGVLAFMKIRTKRCAGGALSEDVDACSFKALPVLALGDVRNVICTEVPYAHAV